jgi:hypothetical protein
VFEGHPSWRALLSLYIGGVAAALAPGGLRVLPEVKIDRTLEVLVLEPGRLIEP